MELPQFLENLLEILREPSVILSNDYKIVSYNHSFKSRFCKREEELHNKLIFDINEKQWNFPEFKKLLTKILPEKKVVKDYEIYHEFENLGIKSLILSIEQFQIEKQTPIFYLVKIEDIMYFRVRETTLNLIQGKLNVIKEISTVFSNVPFKKIFNEIRKILRIVFECEEIIIGYNANGDIIISSKEKIQKTKDKSKRFLIHKLFWDKFFGSEILVEKKFNPKKIINLPERAISIYNSLSCPIKYNNKEIGRILLANKKRGFDKLDNSLLEAISSYIAPLLYDRLKNIDLNRKREKIQELDYTEVDMDHIDQQILCELFKDGTQTLQELSRKIIKSNGDTMSTTGIKKRIKKLKKNQLLRIQGNINLKKINYKAGFYLIKLKDYNDLNDYINLDPPCSRIFLLTPITGKYHIIIGFLGQNLEDINFCINNCSYLNKTKIDIKHSRIIFGLNLEIPKYFPTGLCCEKLNSRKCQKFI